MNTFKRFIFTSISVILPTLLFAQGHEIKFQIHGLKDTTVILGHHVNSTLLPDDTVRVDQKGSGVFKGKTAYPGGMYFLFFKGTYFDFFLDEDQVFYLETDTADINGHLMFKGCEMNEAWNDFQKKVAGINKEREKLMTRKESADDEEKKKIDEQVAELGKNFYDTKMNTIESNTNNLLGIFLKATEDIKVPDFPRDENGNVLDSLFQYKYYRNHFLDNMDISDARLLRTPIYDGKIKRYIEKVVPQIPDTLIKEVDWMVEASRSDDQLFRYMLITLLNTFAKSEIMGMDAVFLHIAEKYYIPEATWSTEKYITELKETVAKQKPLILGSVAPNFQLVYVPSEHFKAALNDTALKRNVFVGETFNIHDLKADYIVLYFWEADCGHCKKASPKLHGLVPELKKMNAQIVACHMLGSYEGKVKWVDFINKNNMYDWLNTWSPYSIEYKEKLDLRSSNQIYLLDKDKKIIAKRISPEQVMEVLKAYEAREHKVIKHEE